MLICLIYNYVIRIHIYIGYGLSNPRDSIGVKLCFFCPVEHPDTGEFSAIFAIFDYWILLDRLLDSVWKLLDITEYFWILHLARIPSSIYGISTNIGPNKITQVTKRR